MTQVTAMVLLAVAGGHRYGFDLTEAGAKLSEVRRLLADLGPAAERR